MALAGSGCRLAGNILHVLEIEHFRMNDPNRDAMMITVQRVTFAMPLTHVSRANVDRQLRCHMFGWQEAFRAPARKVIPTRSHQSPVGVAFTQTLRWENRKVSSRRKWRELRQRPRCTVCSSDIEGNQPVSKRRIIAPHVAVKATFAR